MKKNKMMRIVFTGALATVLATGTGFTVSAAKEEGKEEVIYALTNGSGEVSKVYAVNILDGKKVIDYGTYSEVKLLTQEGRVNHSSNCISYETNGEKSYYQGTMQTKTLPWKIELHYYLDGVEYQPQDLAMKSGKLKITYRISRNRACDESFYKNYSLQSSFSLDGKKCTNIVAKDATILNVGAKKQLTYTKLPGQEFYTEITADVTEFEMDPVTINGMKLNLSIDVDSKELTDKASALSNAIGTVNNNMSKLADGSSDLVSGVKQLEKGNEALANGLATLTKNNSKLNAASKQILDGAISNVNAQINAVLPEKITLTADNYEYKISSLMVKCAFLPAPTQQNVLEKLKQGEAYIKGVQTFVDSLHAYTTGVSNAYDGALKLQQGSRTLKQGIITLNQGSKKLEKGTIALNNKTEKLPDEISDAIDNMISSVQPQNTKIVSFTSAKNKEVSSVQFAIKTEKIKAPEEKKVEQEHKEKKGFFEKLKALF